MNALANIFVRKLLSGGAAAFVLKFAGGGLMLLLLGQLAWMLGPEEFGAFGISFTAATLLATVGSFGQRMASLRFSSALVTHDLNAAMVPVRKGALLVAGGSGGIGLALILADLAGIAPGPRGLAAATGALTFVLALAEYQAHYLRAFGPVASALAPRDLFWRLGALAAFVVIVPDDAVEAIAIMTAILLVTTVAQRHLHRGHGKLPLRNDCIASEGFACETGMSDVERKIAWRSAIPGLWALSVLQIATPQIAVLILGAQLDAASSGAFFAAQRAAGLVALILTAGNIAAGPMIAAAYAEGRYADLAHICRLVAGGSLALASIAALFAALFGGPAMAFFGPGFEHALPALLILIGGQLVNAATGPVSVLLELSGRERTALRLSVIVTIASMPTLWVAVGLWGMEGAATVQALAVSIWTVLAVLMARKIPGIDPSIGGFLWPVRR